MIVDTSAWIDYSQMRGTPAEERLMQAISRREVFFIPPLVVQEVLQGAKNPMHYVQLQEQIERVPMYRSNNWLGIHRHAAMLYARCRWKGITIRSSNDCFIAACALESELPLLANDKDFVFIAQVEPKLKLL